MIEARGNKSNIVVLLYSVMVYLIHITCLQLCMDIHKVVNKAF